MPTLGVRKASEVPPPAHSSRAVQEAQRLYEGFIREIGGDVGELELAPGNQLRSVKVRLRRAATRIGRPLDIWDANGRGLLPHGTAAPRPAPQDRVDVGDSVHGGQPSKGAGERDLWFALQPTEVALMAFFKRLFGRDKKSTATPMRGPSDAFQTQGQPDSTRATMETEVVATPERREGSATPEGWTEREQAIIARVSEAFAGMMLDSRTVDVHTLEGGLSPTLRFTLNETASTDLQRGRIAANDESEDALADVVIVELRRQVVG